MDLSSAPPEQPDLYLRRDRAVLICAYAAGALAAAAAVAVATALLAYGWKQVGWMLLAPGSVGVIDALAVTASIVIVALPLTFVASFFAAGCLCDPRIGGLAGRTLRLAFVWSTGIPSVVIGVSVFFFIITLGFRTPIVPAVLALIALNLPNASARLARNFESVPLQTRQAAAALGASPATIFLRLTVQSAGWTLLAAAFSLAGQMVGETSALVLALGASEGTEPLSVQIWRYAPNASLAGTEAAASLVLVVLVGACFAMASFCRGKHAATAARAL